jgi:spore germination cell wall hydrolase CwlJ-like protein
MNLGITRRQELLSYSPNSAAYQKAGQIVDAVVSGEVPDSTNGATHFLNPTIVKQRRGSLPGWASRPVAKIGAHTFYAPEGRSSASTAPDAF